MNLVPKRFLSGAVVLAVVVGACSSTAATPSPAPTSVPTAVVSTAPGGPTATPGHTPVTITWWHNANVGAGLVFWQGIANEYTIAHPWVTIQITPMQNEDFKTKLPLAMNAGTAPDIFQSWGGGQLRQQVQAGQAKDISADMTGAWASTINAGALSLYQVDGKQYGVPYDLGVVGIWYNKALFTKAGIAAAPATWDDFMADITKLKAAGVAPISVGEKDAWTGAFWWEYLALRECGKDKMDAAVKQNSFTDGCFLKAGEDLKALIDATPFQAGFLGTPAQTGASSATGLLANGKVAMELQGQWEPGVMAPLTPDGKGLGDNLGWFPIPTVTGGAGALTEFIGGGNGFALSPKAPAEAVDFLKFISSKDVMTRRGQLNDGILPTTIGSETSVTDPNLKELISQRTSATFVQLYLDQAFSQAVGQAINTAVQGEFAGASSPADVQNAIQAATKS